ncbi:CotH protein [Helicosporidium sp. ATCC 50920]|nr:CotH protein [Helicosporidium sp. ATCC 50920]|eukprot:KDD76274.1 CotH protein [Helicosporidium sp. ATCC 50920]
MLTLSRACLLACVIVLVSSQARAQLHEEVGRQVPDANLTIVSDGCAALKASNIKSDLPVVIIWTPASNLTKRERQSMTISTCTNDPAIKDMSATGLVRVRGNSSIRNQKKSWALKFRYPNGTNDNSEFLGMPAEHDWALYGGDVTDGTSGMRNYLAYNAARAVGRYASRTVWVNLYLCTGGAPLSEDCYHGMYMAEEPVRRDKDRVDIKKWKPDNPTGGYIVVYDNDNWDSTELQVPKFDNMQEPFIMKDPVPSDPAQAAVATQYMHDALSNFTAALNGPNWLDAKTGYTSHLNFQSWVDYFLLVELSKNPDGYRGSTFVVKDRDGLLTAGPLWDYNEAFGICCGFPFVGYDDGGVSEPGQAGGSAISPNGWRFLMCADPERCEFDPEDGISSWYRVMWKDVAFRAAAARRWAVWRQGPLSDAQIVDIIDGPRPILNASAIRDLEFWSEENLKDGYTSAPVQWKTEMDFLRTWTLERANWMDVALNLAKTADYRYPQDNLVPVPLHAGEWPRLSPVVQEAFLAPLDETMAPLDEAVAPLDEAMAPLDEAAPLAGPGVAAAGSQNVRAAGANE